jgi:hypothetical protein
MTKKIQDKIAKVLKEEQVNEMDENQMVFIGYMAIQVPLFLALVLKFGYDSFRDRKLNAQYVKKMEAGWSATSREIVKYFLEQMATTPHMTDEVKTKYLKIIHKKQKEANDYTGVNPDWVFSVVRSMTKDAPEFLMAMRSDKMLGGMFMRGGAKYKRVRPEGNIKEMAPRLVQMLDQGPPSLKKYISAIEYFTEGNAVSLRLGTVKFQGYMRLDEVLTQLLDEMEDYLKASSKYPDLKEIYELAKTMLNMDNSW